MARPTDWGVLGLDSDPTPGVVESVQALAKEFGDFAHDVEAAWRSLNSFGSDATALSWIGQSADAFKTNFGPLPGRLQKLWTSYSEASDALAAYWPSLQAAQHKADNALIQGRDAAATLQRANSTATTTAADLKTAQTNHATVPNPQAVTDAQTAHDTAAKNLTDAQNTLAGLTATAHQAHDDRIAAAKQCATALHHAQSDGIHNKHWWEHVGEALSEIGGEIAEIANDIAPILDVLALATCWIPGVGEVTAALAEADNLIALAGTGLEIAGDAMQGHWGDALMGVGMLGATYLGGKALGALGGKVLGKFGKEAEGEEGALAHDAEGSPGAKARAADGNEGATTASDPVDVVSGWMLTGENDLALPGVLPLVVGRTYASGYGTGRLFGPGWSSTLDQRLAVNAAGIHFTGDDAQTLHYAVPSGSEAVLSRRGARWPLSWDRQTDEIRISDPGTGQTRHFAAVHYRDDVGHIRDLTAISDRNGNRITVVRTEDGTPVAVEHPGYRVDVDTAVTAAGIRVTALRLADGSVDGVTVKRFGYDDRGRLNAVIDSSGLPLTYGYGDGDRITAWTDRVGYRYTFEYDYAGRVVRATGDGGFLSSQFAYDDTGHTTVVTNSLGHPTTYVYDGLGHITGVTDALGNTTATEYDADGRLLARVDPLGHRTQFGWNHAGELIRTVDADGGVTSFVHNDLGQAVEISLPGDALWRREFDARGNLLTVVDPEGAVTRYEYTATGALALAVDPLGAATRLRCDAAGMPLEVTDPLGGVRTTQRDAFGRETSVTDPLGGTTGHGWSVEGLPLWRVAPDGARTEWFYDAQGRLVRAVDPAGGATVQELGPFSLVLARTAPDGTRHVFEYDTELALTSVTNPVGAVWRYAYDPAGRLASETDYIGRTLAYGHDAAGRVVERVTGSGDRIRIERDAAGRVTGRRTGHGDYSYTYDVGGHLAAATGPGTASVCTRDRIGRLLSETVDGRATRFGYDTAGRVVDRITPSGARTTWRFDDAGRAVGMDTAGGRLDFAFDAAGRERGRMLDGQARLLSEYDAAGRPAAQHLWSGAGEPTAAASQLPALSRHWTWREDGVVVQIDDSLRGSRRYAADARGRVTEVTAAGWREGYAYDDFGNLASAQSGVAGSTTADPQAADDTAGPRATDRNLVRAAGRTTYEHDAGGRLVRTVRRTLDGRRRVWTYTWDSEDRLIGVTVPDGGNWHYSYDPMGRRTGKIHSSVDGAVLERVTFSWDGRRLAEQTVDRADAHHSTLTWDYLPESFTPAAQRRRSWADDAGQALIDEAFHAIVTDLAGAPTELVAADGHIAWHTTTSLWGRRIAASGETGLDCPLRFAGQYHDPETGLHYNLHRYYDPDTASYLTPDPLGRNPAPNDRSYVDNPLTWADPLGLTAGPVAPPPGGGGRVNINVQTPNGTVPTTVSGIDDLQAYADYLRPNTNSGGPHFAAKYTSPSGRAYFGYNGHQLSPVPGGQLDHVLTSMGEHSGCAENMALILAEQAEGPAGIVNGHMDVVKVRGLNSPPGGVHGNFASPCPVNCQPRLTALGISFHT